LGDDDLVTGVEQEMQAGGIFCETATKSLIGDVDQRDQPAR
jgi:hypothetical protein